MAKANGIEIGYDQQGSGPPLLLCHGGEADRRNFLNFAPLLVRDFTVITFDQRDSGETRNGESSYELADLGRDVGALIEALGFRKAHLFGTSWGGVVAQHAALECGDRIDRLILSASWPGGERHVSDDLWRLASMEKTPEQWEAYRALFFSEEFAASWPMEAKRLLEAVTCTRSPEQRARRAPLAFAHDGRARLRTLPHRTLVIAGAKDRIVSPRFSKQLADLIPDARLRFMPRVGHALTLEAPAPVARQVRDFLQEP